MVNLRESIGFFFTMRACNFPVSWTCIWRPATWEATTSSYYPHVILHSWCAIVEKFREPARKQSKTVTTSKILSVSRSNANTPTDRKQVVERRPVHLPLPNKSSNKILKRKPKQGNTIHEEKQMASRAIFFKSWQSYKKPRSEKILFNILLSFFVHSNDEVINSIHSRKWSNRRCIGPTEFKAGWFGRENG